MPTHSPDPQASLDLAWFLLPLNTSSPFLLVPRLCFCCPVGLCILLRLHTYLGPNHPHLWWQLPSCSGSACHLVWTRNSCYRQLGMSDMESMSLPTALLLLQLSLTLASSPQSRHFSHLHLWPPVGPYLTNYISIITYLFCFSSRFPLPLLGQAVITSHLHYCDCFRAGLLVKNAPCLYQSVSHIEDCKPYGDRDCPCPDSGAPAFISVCARVGHVGLGGRLQSLEPLSQHNDELPAVWLWMNTFTCFVSISTSVKWG